MFSSKICMCLPNICIYYSYKYVCIYLYQHVYVYLCVERLSCTHVDIIMVCAYPYQHVYAFAYQALIIGVYYTYM